MLTSRTQAFVVLGKKDDENQADVSDWALRAVACAQCSRTQKSTKKVLLRNG